LTVVILLTEQPWRGADSQGVDPAGHCYSA
jgi:hypothetical protein